MADFAGLIIIGLFLEDRRHAVLCGMDAHPAGVQRDDVRGLVEDDQRDGFETEGRHQLLELGVDPVRVGHVTTPSTKR